MRLVIASLLALMMIVVARADPPLQNRPSGPEPYVGEWSGNWFDSSGTTGQVDMIIKPPQDGALRVLVRASNAIAPGFGGLATFANGELVLDDPKLRIVLVFRLHGDDRLQADYRYRDRPNTGTWSLARKRA